jgi:osmotically inducible protein OsmC
MPDRTATTHWTGPLTTGSGTVSLATSGAGQFPFSLSTRAGDSEGQTGPEELIAAAHSACYSMQLSALLTEADTPPEWIDTSATVTQRPRGDAFPITDIQLTVRASVPGIDKSAFEQSASKAKEICPVSVALAGPTITVRAVLEENTR